MPKVVYVDWKRVRKQFYIDDLLAALRALVRDGWLLVGVLLLPPAVILYVAFVIRPGDPDRAARALLIETQALAEEGRYGQARWRLEDFIARHPDHPVVPEAYLRLARYGLDQTRRGPTVADGLQIQGYIRQGARPGNRDRVAALEHELGLYYQEAGRPDLALSIYEQVSLDDPGYPGRHPIYYRDLANGFVAIQPPDTAAAMGAMEGYIRLVRAGRDEDELLVQRDELQQRIDVARRQNIEIEEQIRLAGPESRHGRDLVQQQQNTLLALQDDERSLRSLDDQLAGSPVPGALADLGEFNMRIGDHETATVAFLEVLINYPKHSHAVERASFHIGRIAFDLGDYEGAAWRLKPLLDSPRRHRIHQEAIYLAAESNRRLGRFLEARELFRFILHPEVDPLIRFRAAVRNASCHFALQDLEGASFAYRHAMGADPARGAGVPGGSLEEVQDFRRLLILGEIEEDALGVATRISGLLAVADAFVETGQLLEALRLFRSLKEYRQADQVYPPDEVYFKIAGIYEGLADAAQGAGKGQEARQHRIEAAMQLIALVGDQVPSGRYKDAWWRAAENFRAAGRRYAEAEALDAFLAGLHQDDRESEALLLCGSAYRAVGLYEQAARRLDENRGRFPRSFFAWESRVSLAECHVAMAAAAEREAFAHQVAGRTAQAEGQRRIATRHMDVAAVELRKMVDDPRISPHAPAWRKAIFALTRVHDGTRNTVAWKEAAEIALSYFPNDDEALPIYFRLASVALEQRRYDEALQGFREILSRWIPAERPTDPSLKYAVFHEADCLYGLDRAEEAADAYRRAADFYHRDGLAPWALFQLGNVHRRAGRATEARDAYARARVVLERLPPEVIERGPEGLGVAAWNDLLEFMTRNGS